MPRHDAGHRTRGSRSRGSGGRDRTTSGTPDSPIARPAKRLLTFTRPSDRGRPPAAARHRRPRGGQVKATNLRQALAQPGFLLSAWPWRSLAYLATSVPVGLACAVASVVLVGVGALTVPIALGVALLAGVAVCGVPLGVLERRRLRLLGLPHLAHGHTTPDRAGPLGWFLTRVREPATWREFTYVVLLCTLLWPLDLILVTVSATVSVAAIGAPLWTHLRPELTFDFDRWVLADRHTAWAVPPVGVLLTVLALYGMALVSVVQGTLARLLLAATPDQARDVELTEIARSRSRLSDAFEAERRRIERDLHDGAQQRLVALTVELGEARLDVPSDAPSAPALDRAQEHAFNALSELRELIRGIHPKVLSDYGLGPALADLADRCAVPVEVTADLPGRLPPSVEATAYFAVSEALTNVDRHSGAGSAELTCRVAGGTLILRVADDGAGGADPAAGTGLAGMVDRLAAVDGTLSLASPPGGPTVLTMEIPCRRPAN
ncbi:sensor histidine kinase [Actinomadura luteofluorescens]|uniref:sensor histidine kinase n=1 Tax=Actinomadura luteofluorescens TaxID=46163 RepID=UPI003D94B323